MIIDFHTHVYPEKIAQRTLEALTSDVDVTAHTDGTVQGLLDSMKTAGVNKSVILPVATRKGQFDSITRYAKSINETHDDLISFGGVHPDDDEIEEKLVYLKDNGFKGVKIHPDYTGTFIDDERYIRIICACQRLGLLVITHAGKDPAYSTVHCPPDRARAMLDEVYRRTGFSKPFFIFAHLGGNRLGCDVANYLIGQNCYIDISCSFADLGNFTDISDEDILKVIRLHGTDRMLFATDSPWNDQKAYVERFKTFKGLSDEEKEQIFHKNAERLLGLC